jgi:hypothetical protein
MSHVQRRPSVCGNSWFAERLHTQNSYSIYSLSSIQTATCCHLSSHISQYSTPLHVATCHHTYHSIPHRYMLPPVITHITVFHTATCCHLSSHISQYSTPLHVPTCHHTYHSLSAISSCPFNHIVPHLYPFAQRCIPRFFTVYFNF